MTEIQPIDKKFLENILNEPIANFTVGPGCKVGDNVAGSLKSITVTTTSGNQHHLIFKRFPEQITQENGFVVFRKVFWREHSIYKIVFPKLEQFARDHGLAYLPPIPKYYTGYNDDKHDYIVIEDVRPDGYRMPDKTVSLTLGEVSLVLKEFARFHAIGYAFIRHEGEQIFKKVDGFQYLVQNEAVKKMIETNFDPMYREFYKVAAKVLQSRFAEGAAKMRKYYDVIGKLHRTMEHLTDTQIFPTLCHFDLWSNNMLIKKNEKGQPVGVMFIDFQFTQRGNIFSDLQYTLYTSTTPEFRKRNLNKVLNLYYDEFCSTLETMKIPLPWGFTRGFFIDKFMAGIGFAFVRMAFAIPLQLGMITRTEKVENDVHAALYTEEGIRKMYKDSPETMQRLEELVREMIECKVFK